MGDFKLRLSDIFRYIVLGAVQVALCYVVLVGQVKSGLQVELTALKSDPVVMIVVAISAFYLCGFLTQMVLMLFCKDNLMGTGLGEVGLFIHDFPTAFLNRNRYPHWIYFSRRPHKVLGIYREIMETGEDADVKTQFLYANSLFQGIALSLVVFSVFEYHDGFSVGTVLLAGAAVLGLCAMGYLSVKYRWALVLNKLLIILVPLTIFLVFLIGKGNLRAGLGIAVALFLCLAIAEQLIRRHITRMDMLIKYGDGGSKESRFIATLKRNGVPRAYILTRVNDSAYPYFRQQLDSICRQIYPNIKVIVLIDKESTMSAEIIDLIEKFRSDGLSISYFISKKTGPAVMAHEIRDIFINYADDTDVAITLDADDMFAGPEVISRIVGRMCRTNANVCLITFETFGDSKLNYSKNYPNELVREIAEKCTENGHALTASQLQSDFKAHLISTIGWTKCYRKEILKSYQRQLDRFKSDMETYSKYEDFPDILAVLSPNSRICAVGRTSVLFRKHAGSVTTAVTEDNYMVHIPYYLWVSRALSLDKEESIRTIISDRFIPYKFLQYLNIVLKKTTGEKVELPGLSADKFFHNFIRVVYGNEPGASAALLAGMVTILNENAALLSEDHSGFYGEDLPDKLAKRDRTSGDILAVYSISSVEL